MMEGYTIFIDGNRISFLRAKAGESYSACDALPKSATELVFDVKNNKQDLIFRTNDPSYLFNEFCGQLEVQEAGGGLVFNAANDVLMIFRRGKWDLPKGKLDKGETIEACAVREVQEETGLKEIVLGDFLLNTYHVYTHLSELVLKKTTWYKMGTLENTLVAQAEEDITEARFVNIDDAATLLENSFENIKLVFRANDHK
jgi:8-oxo-dGTP pyrophosphatase MutT (NUDIX family)